ncbi:ABC transporter ATP-binding protein [Sulfitobacter sp. G21635-S1]|jgi:glycerol transport system ATP-binding protein|uniref:ABC transporter ATP-binding protein n=1 Tax=Sulfitobacter sp. G21635-S1 TaxID=3014043 RepID=UPI0022AF8BA2|nr:ABC transporter ATP-binding protein [Sulfitobacter sp. G21635-S1]MCZ4257812.1 ABC transporter ATP-binding protein [Sulfitobacter sp. G21635-S1]
MAEITLSHLGHTYHAASRDPKDYALKPVDLVWEDGKTYSLLGPSGCGKTTMLNIISGLLTPSEGRLLFDGRDVTGTRTVERNIAQVFQFPVIYTTKTVRQNLAFPLECRGWDQASISARIAHIADILDLTERLDEPAKRLSADLKQIISLGRGLVRDDVAAVLLDEPLTVIDPQMKFNLRRKLRDINKATGITMILVTHDQSEAMSFADEVVVMKDGEVQQSGPPEDLFARPANAFVGYFIGSPPLNLFAVEREGDQLVAPSIGVGVAMCGTLSAENAQIGVRPEHIRLEPARPNRSAPAQVEKVEDLGLDAVYTLRSHRQETFKVKTRHRPRFRAGDTVSLSVDRSDLLLFRDGQLVTTAGT